MNKASSTSDQAEAIALIKAGLIPLYTCGCALTWVLLDYFVTLEREIRFIWPGKNNAGKMLFFWIRYYTILVCLFDVAQIHSFNGFQPSLATCVAMDATIRVVGALSLWPIEVVMQLRIYALYGCNRKIAAINAFLFALSIGGFLYILVHNAQGRAAIIASAKALPIPGCPSIHTGIEWAQWVPATIFEGILFFYVLGKSGHTLLQNLRVWMRSRSWRSLRSDRERKRPTLLEIVVRDNLVYFFGVAGLLIFNNLMVVGATRIPWFSYAPFHAALGIMTCRLLMNLRRSVMQAEDGLSVSPTIQLTDSTGSGGSTKARSGVVLTSVIISDPSFASQAARSDVDNAW